MRVQLGGWIGWTFAAALIAVVPATGAPAAKPAAAPAAKSPATAAKSPATAVKSTDAGKAFAYEIATRTSAYGLVAAEKVWMKGGMLRMEKRTGAGLRILLLRNAKGVYQVNQAVNEGHKWPKAWEKDLPASVNLTGGPQGDPMQFLKRVQGKKTGQETVNGRVCEVWTYSLGKKKGSGQIFRLWVAKLGKQPIKLETRSSTSRGTVNTTAIEYKSYRWGLPLPDSFFDVPRGARISDLSRSAASLSRSRKP
jgi:hypothetical protein